jgi:hypothetical protein
MGRHVATGRSAVKSMRGVLIGALALAAAACFSPTGPDAVAGTPFQLKHGETASLPDNARLRFDTVRADSRCPIDAICITAGDATIAVTLMRSSGNESRDVHTLPAQSHFSYSKFTVTLTELQPYPRSDRQAKPEDYTATFVVDVR